MANKIKSTAQLAREKKHYGWRNTKPRVSEPRPATNVTRQQPANVKKTTPRTSPAATTKNETSSQVELPPLVDPSTPPSPATPKRQAPPAQPSSGCSTPTSSSSKTSTEEFQELESLSAHPIAMAEELQQHQEEQLALMCRLMPECLMLTEQIMQTTEAAERTNPLPVQEELDTSNDSTHVPSASAPVISSSPTDTPPASQPVISSGSRHVPPASEAVASSDATDTTPTISAHVSEVEDLKAAAMESAGDEPSSLAKLALWPLSCIQWCRPALTIPAVDTAVAVVVHIFAAAAALTVLGC